MKPSRFSAFSRCVLGVAAVTTLSFHASAQTQLYWKTNAAAADWGTAANWSTAAASGGATSGAAPGTTAVANFSVTSPPNTGAQTVTVVPAGASVRGLATPAQTVTTTIRSDGTAASFLNIGDSGITHTTGGLTIGSSTAAQALEVRFTTPALNQPSQTWTSSTTGGGAAALVIHNNVTFTATGTSTDDLNLRGTNTGSTINGNITAPGTMKLNVVKYDSGLWTLAGTANNITGDFIINEGTIRLTNAGAATPARTIVVPGATLSLRSSNGTTGFTAAQLDTYRTNVIFDPGGQTPAVFAIDTANGNFQYDSALSASASPGTQNFDFKKLGANTLTLTGNNSQFPHKTIVSEGTLALATPNARPGLVTVEPVGTLAAVVGGAGFTVSEITSLIASTTFNENSTDKGSFGLSTANGDVVYPSVLGGAIRFNKSGANTLAMTADNTYTGATMVSGGSLSISRFLNGGIPSPLGTSANTAGNLILAGGRLTYTGPAVAPDRLFSMSTNGGIDASGTGPLTFGAGTITHTGTSGRFLTLSGINQDANTIASTLTNSGTGGSITSVYKTGYGNWFLTGPSTATGLVRGRGGNVTLDYASVDPWAGGALIQSGSIILKAKAGGTTETMSNLQIGEQHNGLGILKLTGGMNLTVTSLDGNAATQRHNLIDLSGNGGSITVTTLNTTFSAANNGLLNNNAATLANARANLVLRANDNSYGFAALAPGTTTGLIQKLAFVPAGILTPGTVTIDTNTTNYYLGAGSYTTAGTAVFSTLTLDSAAGAVNFALGGTSTFNPSSTGKAILATGANDVTISGGNTTSVLNQPLWVHNYVDPSATFNINSNMGTGGYFIIGGTGYTNYSGLGLGQKTTPSDTQFVLNGGVFRMTTDQDLATPAGVLRVTDAIFEIGADLNGTATGDFTRASGTSFRLLGNAGFSAHTATPGGTRVAEFSNFSNATPLVWGAADFLTNSVDNTDGDYAFRFGSARSNATIEFKNAIDLNGHLRVVEVANGDPVNGAETDAVLSGVLSGNALAGLVKTGPGTLSLTGLNTYGGETRAMEGVLKIKAGSIPAGSRLVIGPNGKVNVSGNVGVQSVVINGVEQGPGAVNAPAYITGGGALYVGAAPAGMTYAQWVTNKTLQPAESGELFDADKDGLLNLLEYGLGTEPKIPNGSVLTHNAGNGVFRFTRATDRTDITTIIEASETMTGTWATIATSNGIGAFVLQAGVTGVSINESTPGTVIVTSSGTMPSKKFYRVRVTK